MTKSQFNTVLVPVDFSSASEEAFMQSQRLVGGDEPVVIALHVIDESLVELLVANGLDDHDDLTSKLRQRSEERLRKFTETRHSHIQITRVVSIGEPFLEIIRKAEDFAVDAIVMGKVGRGPGFEKLLFGSTAERVIRGSMRPVFVFPQPAHA